MANDGPQDPESTETANPRVALALRPETGEAATIRPNGPVYGALTDSEGRAELTLPHGRFVACVGRMDRRAEVIEVVVDERPREVFVVLSPLRDDEFVRGQVLRGTTTEPIPRARVVARPSGVPPYVGDAGRVMMEAADDG